MAGDAAARPQRPTSPFTDNSAGEEHDVTDDPLAATSVGTSSPAPSTAALSRHWAILAARQVVMSGVTLVAGLYLAIVLPPAEFVVFGYAVTVFLLATAAGDLGLGAALIRDGPTRWRLERSLGLALAVWCAVAAALTTLSVVSSLSNPSRSELVLLVVTLTLVSVQMLPTALLEQRLQFGRIAVLEATQRGLFLAIACIGASVSQSGEPIAVGAAASAAFGVAAALWLARWRWLPRVAGGREVMRGFAPAWWRGRLASQLNYASYVVLGSLLFSEREVGLMVWALSVTSVPTILAPLAGRVLLPNLAITGPDERTALFRRLFVILTFVSLPLIAVLFVCAEQFTRLVFGADWVDGIVLIRLECVTTVLGVALTPSAALLFLTLDPRRVARIMVAWAVASYALTLLLAGWLGYRAPSAAQIVTAAIALVVFDRLLRSQGSVPLIRGVAPGAIALVVVAVPGLLLASMIESPSATIALALGVAAAQILMMEKLSRRSVRDDARSLVDGLAGTVRALQAIRR